MATSAFRAEIAEAPVVEGGNWWDLPDPGPAKDALLALAAGDDIPALVAAAEEFELDLGHETLSDEVSLSLYTIQLAAYLLTEQLELARHLWRRLPSEKRETHAEICALWEVCRSMWQQDHAAVQSGIAAFGWSPLMAPLMARLQVDALVRGFAICSQAYCRVTAAHLSTVLGVPEARVHELAEKAGWTVDAEEPGVYLPVAPEVPPETIELPAQLEKLTNYVAHIEKELR
jgi:COP9 signalosome complex subunit 8